MLLEIKLKIPGSVSLKVEVHKKKGNGKVVLN